MKKTNFHKVVIGRAELISFLDANLIDVPAKIDTGAYRSAVHADSIKELPDGTLQYRLLGGHKASKQKLDTMQTTEFKKVWIANSFGHREERFEVKLKVKLGPRLITSAFTLADRSAKIYPVLVGRKLLNNRYIIDTTHTSINRIELKKQYGIELPKDEEDEQPANK